MTSPNNVAEQPEDQLTVVEPERIESQVVFPAIPATHNWRQRGIEIYCTSCNVSHGFFVRPNDRLVGVIDGKPVLHKD